MDNNEKAEAPIAKDSPIERPLECSECHRPIKVLYTEVIGKNSTTYHMCSECPVLHSKLQGQTIFGKEASGQTPLCCGSCGLSSEDLHKGSMLGCSLCYDIFKDEILHELNAQKRLPESVSSGNSASLHVGRRAGASAETSPSLQLSTLQQALHDTLGREDYEQAAYLRDQIKALEERNKSP